MKIQLFRNSEQLALLGKKMKIDRKHVEDTFRKYTNAYDSTDEKIRLKIAHTYRVAALCERIAQADCTIRKFIRRRD